MAQDIAASVAPPNPHQLEAQDSFALTSPIKPECIVSGATLNNSLHYAGEKLLTSWKICWWQLI